MTILWVFRWVAVVEALILVGWAIAVVQEARKFRPPNVYVRLVTISYILLVILAAVHSLSDRHPASLAFRVMALTYGLAAMAAMYHHYRYEERVRRHSAESDGAARRLRESAGLRDDDERR